MKIFSVSVLLLCSLILPCITVTQSDDRCDEYEVNVSGETEHRDVFRRVKREFVPYKTGKLVARQVSNALDHLLFFSGYDKRIRPQVRLKQILYYTMRLKLVVFILTNGCASSSVRIHKLRISKEMIHLS